MLVKYYMNRSKNRMRLSYCRSIILYSVRFRYERVGNFKIDNNMSNMELAVKLIERGNNLVVVKY